MHGLLSQAHRQLSRRPSQLIHIPSRLRHGSSPLLAKRYKKKVKTTYAITREIPDSFLKAVVQHHSSSDENNAVSLIKARSQHNEYVKQLRRHVPRVLTLPPLETHPDCVFVEDAVVAVGGKVVITQMGHLSRKGEVDSIKKALLDRIEGMSHLYDMREDENALCDGGDVMYTGRHLFVGQSNRTNTAGFEFLRDAFTNYEDVFKNDLEVEVISVPPVVAGKDVLHLKSAVTHLDEYTILAPEGKIGDDVLEAMNAKELGYESIRLPDVLSCNVVVANDHVLVQDSNCKVSRKRIKEACKERSLGLTFVDTSELAKKDGALTCCSVLLQFDLIYTN